MSNLLFFSNSLNVSPFFARFDSGKGKIWNDVYWHRKCVGTDVNPFPFLSGTWWKSYFFPIPNIRCTHIPHLVWYRIQAVTFHTSNHSTHTHARKKKPPNPNASKEEEAPIRPPIEFLPIGDWKKGDWKEQAPMPRKEKAWNGKKQVLEPPPT